MNLLLKQISDEIISVMAEDNEENESRLKAKTLKCALLGIFMAGHTL